MVKSQLEVIDQPLILNAVSSGVAIAFLLGYPIFKYVKEINKMNQTGKSYIEIFFTTMLMHIGFLLIIVGVASIVNVVVGDNTRFTSYAPKYGTAFIMGLYDSSGSLVNTTADNFTFWNTWEGIVQLAKTGGDTAILVIKSSIVVIGLALTVLWFCLFLYPPFCIFFPIFMAIRKDTQGNPSENTYLKKIYFSLVVVVCLVVLSYIHFMIASIYVSFQTGVEFSFWKQMTTIWGEILDGKGRI